MRALWMIVVMAGCMSLPAQAQKGTAGDRPARPRAGGEKGAGQQKDRGEMAGPNWAQKSLTEVARNLADKLELTKEQRTQYDKLVDKYSSAWTEAQNVAAQRRDLMRQMRSARQSGDEKHAEELRKQIEQLGAGPLKVLADFVKEVEPLLNEAQLAKLNQFREQVMQRGGRRGAPGQGPRADNVRAIIHAARQLTLTDEQKTKLREIVRTTMDSAKPAEMDAEARAALAKSVKKQVVEMLTAEQTAAFEKLLQAAPQPGKGAGPGAGEPPRDGPRRNRSRKPAGAPPADGSGGGQ